MLRCVLFICGCGFLGLSNASAIPMWEYLSKQEKMSYIYSMFANLVEDFCESSTLHDCNKELLKYGLNTLKKTNEVSLDRMDPYQKDSHHIIWAHMLLGYNLAASPPKEKPSSTTPAPNSYDDDKTIVAAASDLDNVYSLPPPEGVKSDYPPNVAALIDAPDEDKGFFERLQELYVDSNNSTEVVPLNGPVVIKVYPDGTPVDEVVPEHHDEDLKQHLLTQVIIPESI